MIKEVVIQPDIDPLLRRIGERMSHCLGGCLGVALYGSGDYKDAAAAFASAYYSGENTKLVEENWQRADKADKKERGEERIPFNIKTAARLANRSLCKHIVYSFKPR
jgi:hypothetical protein